MTEQADAARLEQILRTVDFFKPVATRRSFMRRLMLVGGGAATGAAGLGHVTSAFADAAIDFVNAAVGAERIGIAFYGNTLGTGSPFSIASDVASTTLLNSAHRVYFRPHSIRRAAIWLFCRAQGVRFLSHTSAFRQTPSTAPRRCLPWGCSWSRSLLAPTWVP